MRPQEADAPEAADDRLLSPATSPSPVEVITLESNYPLPYGPTAEAARPYLLIRGNVHQRGQAAAGWPAVFGPTPSEAAARGPRSALADWLTDPANPLPARVWANRVWAAHFGRGLVETPNDFGIKGARPSHPQLLDFLAGELVRSGWSTKHLHRLIVNSATYRRACAARRRRRGRPREPLSRPLVAAPPRDRGDSRRHPGDERRAVATAGGPSIPLAAAKDRKNGRPAETETLLRRSLYLEQRRGVLPPMQALFDGPTANEKLRPAAHLDRCAAATLLAQQRLHAEPRQSTGGPGGRSGRRRSRPVGRDRLRTGAGAASRRRGTPVMPGPARARSDRGGRPGIARPALSYDF